MKNIKSRLLLSTVSILISLGTLLTVGWICSMVYTNSCVELEEQYLSSQGKEIIDTIENSVNFGKDLDHYYGMEELLSNISKGSYHNVNTVVFNNEAEILYSTFKNTDTQVEVLAKILTKEMKHKIIELGEAKQWKNSKVMDQTALVYPIFKDNKEFVGNIMILYRASDLLLKEEAIDYQPLLILWCMVSFILLIFNLLVDVSKTEKRKIRSVPVLLIMGTLFIYMMFMYRSYQGKYESLVLDKAGQEADSLNGFLEKLNNKGLPMERISDISGYLDKKVEDLDAIDSISVVQTVYRSPIKSYDTEENKGIHLSVKNSSLILDVQPSQYYLKQKVQNMTLVFAAIFIICLMVTYELSNFTEVIASKLGKEVNSTEETKYKEISAQIRFISFFSYTAVYLSMPYAAVIMKNWNAVVFGFTKGVSASLPLMVELFSIALSSVLIQKFFSKVKFSWIGKFGYLFLIFGNLACAFAMSPYILIGLRAFCGVGFAFLKYWMNAIIASGSKDAEGSSKNYAGLNAGLLGGITVGAALGGVFAEGLGYQSNYYFTSLVTIVMSIFTGFCLPYSFLNKRRNTSIEMVSDKPLNLGKILRDREVQKVLLFGCIPLNVGLMYVVAFIPIYMNHVGQSGLAVSYAYLINGLSGVYFGVLLVSVLKKLSNRIAVGITMLLAALGILVLAAGNNIGVLLFSSAVMGLFDGYGNPSIIRYFTGLKAIKGGDVAGMLTIFNSLGSGIQIICPILYNILIQQNGKVTYLILFGCCYAAISLVFLLSKKSHIMRRLLYERKIH